ncbi:MAG: hypothetical protein JNK87_11710 [Bryobacterales bacterium]|nr:hypothetical protein [Bryobacterales bacterium]
MKICADFILERLPGREGEPPRSRLIHKGAELPVVVEGVVLETQVLLADGRYLLVLTDDCPFEEQVHVILLDRFLRVRDRYRFGKPYTPGVVESVAAKENTLRFLFAGLHFEVKVREKPDTFQWGARLIRYLQVTTTPAAPREPA